jgi:hypothetical protein
LLNNLQAYAFGYLTGKPYYIHVLTAFMGLSCLIFLLLTRQFLLFLAIGLSSGTFALYFPPIPAYMYANYLLIFYGVFIGSGIDLRRWPRRRASARV